MVYNDRWINQSVEWVKKRQGGEGVGEDGRVNIAGWRSLPFHILVRGMGSLLVTTWSPSNHLHSFSDCYTSWTGDDWNDAQTRMRLSISPQAMSPDSAASRRSASQRAPLPSWSSSSTTPDAFGPALASSMAPSPASICQIFSGCLSTPRSS